MGSVQTLETTTTDHPEFSRLLRPGCMYLHGQFTAKPEGNISCRLLWTILFIPVPIAMLMGLFGTDRSRELWWHRFIKGTLYTFEHTRRLRIKAVLSATAFTGHRLQGGHYFRRIPFIKIIEIKVKTKNWSNSRRYSSFNNLIEAFYELLYQSKLDLWTRMKLSYNRTQISDVIILFSGEGGSSRPVFWNFTLWV